MNTNLIHQRLATLLAQLTQQLKINNLWQQQAPTKQALASTAPFCCDTLSFAQWLQFIFIERMTLMAKSKAQLPNVISLCPMAEEAFKLHDDAIIPLITTIADIDELLSGKREQTRHE